VELSRNARESSGEAGGHQERLGVCGRGLGVLGRGLVVHGRGLGVRGKGLGVFRNTWVSVGGVGESLKGS